MNQILATDIGNKKKTEHAIDKKKIVVFFACALFLFGAVFIGVNGYKVYNREKEKSRVIKPELAIEQVGDKIRINASYETGIAKVIYYWDASNVEETITNGSRSYSKEIEIPPGTNTLIVRLEGEDGEKKEVSAQYTGKADNSTIEITISKEDGINLKIVVKNPRGLKYITYKWNEGEEEHLNADPDNPNTIEVEVPVNRLDIGRGKNEITVTAMDILDRQETRTTTVTGQHEPEVAWMQYDNIVECTVTHDMGFKSIEFIANGNVVFVYDANNSSYSATKTSVTYQVKLGQGENIVGVIAESREGTTLERKGRAMYPPEE